MSHKCIGVLRYAVLSQVVRSRTDHHGVGSLKKRVILYVRASRSTSNWGLVTYLISTPEQLLMPPTQGGVLSPRVSARWLWTSTSNERQNTISPLPELRFQLHLRAVGIISFDDLGWLVDVLSSFRIVVAIATTGMRENESDQVS